MESDSECLTLTTESGIDMISAGLLSFVMHALLLLQGHQDAFNCRNKGEVVGEKHTQHAGGYWRAGAC
jgi:hypothetical protein